MSVTERGVTCNRRGLIPGSKRPACVLVQSLAIVVGHSIQAACVLVQSLAIVVGHSIQAACVLVQSLAIVVGHSFQIKPQTVELDTVGANLRAGS